MPTPLNISQLDLEALRKKSKSVLHKKLQGVPYTLRVAIPNYLQKVLAHYPELATPNLNSPSPPPR